MSSKNWQKVDTDNYDCSDESPENDAIETNYDKITVSFPIMEKSTVFWGLLKCDFSMVCVFASGHAL